MLSKAGFATLTPIRNMDRAIGFYTKTLGGKLQTRAKGEMKDMWASIKIGKEEIWLVRNPKAKKSGLAYSTFQVKNIKAEVTELKKRGAKFDSPERTAGWTTKVDGPISYDPVGATAFLKDSEGNLLMLFQATT
jgi:predicted enzyme related to lactoylglutathione lyase